MKRSIIVIAVVLAVAGGAVWFAKSNNGTNTAVAGVSTSESEFEVVQRAIKDGAKLYDVRTAAEYSTGHFANAQNWPLQDMQVGSLPEVAKDTKIYVYCRSGNRSGQSAKLLQQAGYTGVVDLGGVAAIESMGGVLVTN